MPQGSTSYNNGPNDPPGSTKNVLGNKPARGGGDPFAYLKLTPDHAYLGRFRQEKILEEGHNTRAKKRAKVLATTPGGYATRHAGEATVVTKKTRRGADVYTARSVERISKKTAKAAIRAGGEAGAKVAAARPVLAAKVAAREAGAGRQERRAMVRAARKSPESASSERQARRRRRRGMY